MFYTYILHSVSHNRYYFGSTKDIHSRLVLHNKEKVRSTKAFCP
ncbi:MAG: GIY-YIG nuclease family protein [Melioribacteraceae bacterium]|nr:GIY-YIG nuclease family protein [Melioribacteraceae bacterium]MCF8265664.1 GIY-YIG nuclease family protein [Melioribacteraceae bacterium]